MLTIIIYLSLPNIKEGYGLGRFVDDSIYLTKIMTNANKQIANAIPRS